MKHFSTLLSAAALTLSLASCSKESYTFQQSASYHNSTATRVATAPVAAAPVEAATAPELTASVAAAPAAAPATHKAARTYAAHVRATAPAATTKAAVSEVKVTKATVKEMRKALKVAKAAAPAAEGKSQIVAAVLCFFLGGLGIHDFYLGYTGKGILQIFLTLLFGIGFILVLIDFIRILTGSLKPKGGDYAKKF